MSRDTLLQQSGDTAGWSQQSCDEPRCRQRKPQVLVSQFRAIAEVRRDLLGALDIAGRADSYFLPAPKCWL